VPHLGSEHEQAEGKLWFEVEKESSGEDVICLARISMTPEGFLSSVSHLYTEEEKGSEKKRGKGKQKETWPISQSYRFNESPTNPHHPLTTPYTHTPLCLMCGIGLDKNSIVGEGSLGKNKIG